MIVADGQDRLVKVPQNRDASIILEATVVGGVADLPFVNRILLERKAVVEVDPEVAYENIERQLRTRREEQTVGVVLRMLRVKRVAEADVEAQRVQLRDRPEHVQ